MRRIRQLLVGADSSEARVRTAIVIAAINGTATHPMVAELDDDVLRRELLLIADRILGGKAKSDRTA
jgi:hypothetical protein